MLNSKLVLQGNGLILMVNPRAQSDPSERGSAAEVVADWLDQHGDAVYAYARQRVEHEHVAEELVQDTFLAALQNYDRFAGRSSAKTWLIAILRNKLITHYRERSRRRGQPLDQEVPEKVFDARGIWQIPVGRWPGQAEQVLVQEEFWETFDDCLSKLPATAAEVFVLRVFDELDTESICKTLEISTTNLAVRLHRARIALRNCLENNWFGGK